MRDFMRAHNNATKLEQEMNRERVIMMNASSGDCDWYIIKTKYAGLSAERQKETDKILAILEELEDKYADITENTTNDLVSSSEDNLEVNSLYNESIPINEEQFIQRSASRISVKVEPEPEPEPRPEPQMSNKPLQFVSMSQNDVELVSVPVPMPSNTANLVLPKVQPKKVQTTVKPKKRVKAKRKVVVSVKYNTGYKYGGKGFDVFIGFKNKSQPIYGATTLYCRETKNQDKKLLREYLENEGNFGGKTSIESISFGYGRYGQDVAYIRVRGSLKTIKNKMKQLNKKNGAVLSIYERRQYYSAASKENNVLYVNNFDIADKTVHRRFTNLFLKYGQLVKDIKMGIDRNNDPYAIVHFAHLEEARACYNYANNNMPQMNGDEERCEIRFGGKRLSVSYSKM